MAPATTVAFAHVLADLLVHTDDDDVSGRLCVEVARGMAEVESATSCEEDNDDEAPVNCARMEAEQADEYDDAS